MMPSLRTGNSSDNRVSDWPLKRRPLRVLSLIRGATVVPSCAVRCQTGPDCDDTTLDRTKDRRCRESGEKSWLSGFIGEFVAEPEL